MSIFKKSLKIVIAVILVLLLIIGGYVAYYLLSYSRIEDNLELEIVNAQSDTVKTEQQYTVASYNIGFGAYTQDFGFFMDGGTEGRAWSKESVKNTVNGAIGVLSDLNADIIFVQEVDLKSTRSYRVNEYELFVNAFQNYSSAYAINYDSPYLLYPFSSPLGASKSGLMTLTKFNVTSSIRRSFPVETGFSKYFDLDRCYSVSRVPCENGKELVLYSIHLSAYTSDGKIADEQFSILANDMANEYAKGNYVICGGDFNKDLLGNSSEIFGVSGKEYTWAQPVKEEALYGKGLKLVKPFDEDNPVPTCRNADGPYNKDQFVLTIDGFIVSDNVTVSSADVIDTSFLYSDHNPVKMTITLNS